MLHNSCSILALLQLLTNSDASIFVTADSVNIDDACIERIHFLYGD